MFLSLFAGMLLASDRTTTFLTRLFASPMTAADFICGYTLPMLVVCLVQSILTFAFAALFGFQWSARVVVGIAVILPTALMYTAIGLLCGTIVSDKAVGGICGAMLTTVSFILSGLTMLLTVMGHAFQTIAQTLPFYHAAQMANAAIAGDYGRIWPHMWIVLIYMSIFAAAAILTFTMRARNR